MAITVTKDKNKNKNTTFIGLKMPLGRGDVEGYFESTTLTIDAIKENIRSLLTTRKGERVFHPDFGLGLDRLLFENITEEIKQVIIDDITDTIKKWLPYITVKNIGIITDELNTGMSNRVNISVNFFVNNSPTMLDSVTVSVE